MYIFIYGSLKKGFSNDYLLDNSEFLGEAITVDKFCMKKYPGYNFPYLSKEESVNIIGELYKIEKSVLKDLDILEENGSFYQREEISVLLNGIKIKAFCYFIIEPPKNEGFCFSFWG